MSKIDAGNEGGLQPTINLQVIIIWRKIALIFPSFFLLRKQDLKKKNTESDFFRESLADPHISIIPWKQTAEYPLLTVWHLYLAVFMRWFNYIPKIIINLFILRLTNKKLLF